MKYNSQFCLKGSAGKKYGFFHGVIFTLQDVLINKIGYVNNKPLGCPLTLSCSEGICSSENNCLNRNSYLHTCVVHMFSYLQTYRLIRITILDFHTFSLLTKVPSKIVLT